MIENVFRISYKIEGSLTYKRIVWNQFCKLSNVYIDYDGGFSRNRMIVMPRMRIAGVVKYTVNPVSAVIRLYVAMLHLTFLYL